jgi:hypothetical protein
MSTEQFANKPITTLNGAIDGSVTSVVVIDASLYPLIPQFRILIENEYMLVTGVTGNTFTVTRGVESTSAVPHANGVPVIHVLTAEALNQLRTDASMTPAQVAKLNGIEPGAQVNLPVGTTIGTVCSGADSRLQNAAIVYSPTSIPADSGETWVTGILTLPAPGGNTAVYDYLVRAYGYQSTSPTTVYVDESVVLRVSLDAAGTTATLMGHNKPFDSPKLRATLNASSVTIDVRPDAVNNWSWTAQARRIITGVPFDGNYKSKVAGLIGTGSAWVTLISIPAPTKDGSQMTIAYAVRGRFNTSGSNWSFVRRMETLAITCANYGNVLIAETSTTFQNARIRATFDSGTSSILIQAQQDADNWTFSAEATLTREWT